jgi:acyl-CoA synthetase (AMP-forming)/AMP-acid ligase II
MTQLNSMVELLARQASDHGDREAFRFLPERNAAETTLTFAELDRRARAFAARLLRQAVPGERALLLFLPGLDFVIAFFGCLAAGVIGVPLMPPRRAGGRDSSAEVIADCSPRLALTSADLAAARPDLAERFGADLAWITVDAATEATEHAASVPAPGPDDIAFLQYTSGSTSSPKGVMVTHGNLLADMEMIRVAMRLSAQSTSVGWVPVYHDMGLMMGVMLPLYIGALSVMMPPASFMQRPLNWLRAIGRFRAEVASAPNFAFDLCADRFRPDLMEGVDLTGCKVAMNAAEPVQAETVARFAETFAPYGFEIAATFPAYGLAEATLMVTASDHGAGPVQQRISRAALLRGRAAAPKSDGDAQDVVASGRVLAGQRIAIVDADSREPRPPNRVGEIWVSGDNVAPGYWRNPEATEATFHARLAGAHDGAHWLRTGDLGFLDESGALYVTGRIKDLIIVRGVNHYPQDIERTVQNAHPALRRDWGAAFAVADAHGVERLVLVQEVERTLRHGLDLDVIAARIREAVASEHEIAVHDIALIRPASLPKTTSGKVQRTLARQLWEEGRLERV